MFFIAILRRWLEHVGTHLSHSDQELELNEPLRSRTGVEKKFSRDFAAGLWWKWWNSRAKSVAFFLGKIDENRMTINNKDTCFII